MGVGVIKYLLTLILFCGIAGSVFAAGITDKNDGQPELNSVLASVNGEPILLGDVLPMTRVKEYQSYAAYSGERLEQVIRELRKKAVDELIERKLVIADYYRQNVRIQSRDIEAELDRVAIRMNCNSRKEFLRKLRESGVEFEDFKKNIEKRMIVQLMHYRIGVITGEVTPREVYEYYQKHRKDYAGAETIELAMLKLDDKRSDFKESCEQIKKSLAGSPDAFYELVRRYTPEMGDGRLGVIERGKLRTEFQAVLQDVTVGKIYGPLKIDDGTVWLKIIAHNPAKEVSFSEVEEKIKNTLNADIRDQAFKKYAEKLRKDAMIEYFF